MGACGISHEVGSNEERKENIAAIDAFRPNIDIYANRFVLVRSKIELF